MADAPPPRLTVLAARDAPVAVVLRRSPSDWARLHLWHLADDRVEDGGWLRGRVDGRRVDLSPDGRLLVAFVAAEGRGGGPGRDTWVAISRPPWWRALALWFDGSTWSFGGFFADARRCVGLGPGAPDEGEVPGWFDADGDLIEPRPGREWTTETVPHNRRLRDGWTLEADGWWRRALADGGAALIAPPEDGGAEAAVRTARGELAPLGEGASLEVDSLGRALCARGGRLEVIGPDGSARVVADLAGQCPDPAPAPDWAGRWPDAPPVRRP